MSKNYIFGYGSIINSESRRSTLAKSKTPCDTNEAYPVMLSKDSGYVRKWCFRSQTGFSALGLQKCGNARYDIFGVLFPVDNSLDDFDIREIGYERVSLSPELLRGRSLSDDWMMSNLADSQIWVYIPETNQLPDEDFPILQTYLDVCLRGCLEWGGEQVATEFLLSTEGWSEFFLNDAPLSRRPWLHRPDFDVIDKILSHSDIADHVHWSDRRHPEEYSSRHTTSLSGMWGVPPRNDAFVGREGTLANLHDNVFDKDMSQSLRPHCLTGMGGVGKSQIAVEYCHRHFGSNYGLVLWLKSETSASLVADIRKFSRDLSIVKSVQQDETEEYDDGAVTDLFKKRLSRCRCKWLIVFDNIAFEDPNLLFTFLPKVQLADSVVDNESNLIDQLLPQPNLTSRTSRGHVILTSRIVVLHEHISSINIESFQRNESVRFLTHTLGPTTDDSDPQDDTAIHDIADRLGDLPLALSNASAYMCGCDVGPVEYLQRLDASIRDISSSAPQDGIGQVVTSMASTVNLTLDAMHKLSKPGEMAVRVLYRLSFLAAEGISKELVKIIINSPNFHCIEDNKCVERKPSLASLPTLVATSSIAINALIVGALTTLVTVAARRTTNRGPALSVAVWCTAASISASLCAAAVWTRFPAILASTAAVRTAQAPASFSYLHLAQHADGVWEIMKQFGFLSVRGPRKSRIGTIHRLQLACLRSRVQSLSSVAVCIQDAIWALDSMWDRDFFKGLERVWESSARLMAHLQSLVNFVLTHRVQISQSSARVLSVLLTEGAAFAITVLSRFDVAITMSEAAILTQDSYVIDHDEAFILERSRSLHLLGKILRIRSQFGEALKALTSALQLRTRPQDVADTLHELGVLCLRRGKLDEASDFLKRSLAVKRSEDYRVADSLSSALPPTSLAATLHQLASVMVARQRYEEAQSLLTEALMLEDKLLLQPTSGAGEQSGFVSRAATLMQLGRVAIRSGKLAEAEQLLQASLQSYLAVYGVSRAHTHINVAAAEFQLGCCLSALRRHEEATAHFSNALMIRELVYKDDLTSSSGNIEILITIQHLAQCQLELAKVERAEELFTRQQKLCELLLNDASLVCHTDDPGLSKLGGSFPVGSEKLQQAETQEATITKALIFALYSLRTIAKKRGDHERANYFHRKVQLIKKIKPPNNSTQSVLSDSFTTIQKESSTRSKIFSVVISELVRCRDAVRMLARKLQTVVKHVEAKSSNYASRDAFRNVIDLISSSKDNIKRLQRSQEFDETETYHVELLAASLDSFIRTVYAAIEFPDALDPNDLRGVWTTLFCACDELRESMRSCGVAIID